METAPRRPFSNLSTRRIKLTVAYDGTDFCGWAAQTGWRTVQGTLTEAVRRVSGEDVDIVGASRTDGGAHALGQVCHFDGTDKIEPAKWAEILNRAMDDDVAVVQSAAAQPDFNSRFCAIDRTYRYRILIETRDPIRARICHFHYAPLDVVKMRSVADAILGKHDFLAFTEELGPDVRDTARKIFAASVSQTRDEVHIQISGTAFMRGMMRRIAGLMLEIGRGVRDPDDVHRLLGPERDSLPWPVVLPAKGLTLVRVRYGRHPKDHRDRTASNNDLESE